MIYQTDDQPIVACSTGLSENTAIGVIRLSGFTDLVGSIGPFFKKDLSKLEIRKATFVNLYDIDGNFLDEVVITYFKGPNSYNGENILEIAAHGNTLNLKRIMNAFINSGNFRLAKNGEFTYRALKNKKLSLAQVEGLDALLNASSSLMLDEGLKLLNGSLYQKYTDLYDKFLKLKAAVEINIDFAEDVGEEQSQKLLDEAVSDISTHISSLHRSASVNAKSLMSPDIVLCGEPNAGKSSLFNLFLDESRSIVSDIAGTTRDYISEYISLGNETFKLVDTAGLRNTTDVIEEEGIKRSRNLIDNAFYKILLVNINEVEKYQYHDIKETLFDALIFTHFDEFEGELNLDTLKSNLPKAIKYYSADTSKGEGRLIEISGPIGPKTTSGSIEPKELEEFNIGPMGANQKNGPIEPQDNTGPTGAKVGNNQKTGPIEPAHITDLITQDILSKYTKLRNSDPISIERHRIVINDIYSKFSEFSSNIKYLDDIAIISSEVSILEKKTAELIGIISPDDTLTHIFTNFCIGK
ncbi:ferrous iron transport protein B [Halobacteriovorax sp. BALOs_7]|uniref:tRNA modification GTPase n=1 Tax=Halobacteriovorax sp. BALOs_7 TaxID=2109558 RepID=UPI000EA3B8EA|nr:GTPase [Halobacteriovorax sp. BALOs_7]AYF46025.1 ferrous iron transport protein B [Halobacteriovorax sp. BALOs_7]